MTTFQDIQRVRVPEAEMAQRRLAAIVASSNDAIYTKRIRDGLIDSWNPAAERLYGYSAEEMIGGSIATVLPPERQGEDATLLARLMAGERIEQFETERLHRSGERVHVSLSLTPLVNEPTAQIFGIATIAHDITRRKRAEDDLAEARRDLEMYAAELERSNGELEQFAYVASHDLSEPLRAIGGYLQLLERRYEEQLDDEARRYIGNATDGVERMRQLITDLLGFSRVGRAQQRIERVDVADVVEHTVASLRPAIDEAQASIVVGELPTLSADRTQLAQLLQNLISNGLKFHGEQPPRIELSSYREEAGWTLVVADRGIGVDPRFRDRIFEIFRRLHHRRDYAGTGIGLAICKRIAEGHGGRIWVEDNPGGGSAFHVALPDREASA